MHFKKTPIALAAIFISAAPLAAQAAPTVSFKQPTSGKTLSGKISGSACEVTGSNIAKTRFWLGNTWLTTDQSSPWTCELDTTKFKDGSYTLRSTAYDKSGASKSTQISVTIKNSGTVTPPPPPPDDGGTTTPPPTSGTPISSADVVSRPSTDVPFAQQSGFDARAMGKEIAAPAIPEAGITGAALSNGDTVRFGKVADPLNAARKAFAFQLAPADPVTAGGKRSEIQLPANLEAGKTYWLAMRVLVNSWGTLPSGDFAAFGPMINPGDETKGLSPSFGIYTNGSANFEVRARYSTSTSPTSSNTVTQKFAAKPIAFGKWMDIVVKFRKSTTGTGLLQVWTNGTQIVNYTGNLGYNTPGKHPYAKIGYANYGSFSTSRKVLVGAPVVINDPTGSKYAAADLRAFLSQTSDGGGAANAAPTVALTTPTSGATLSGTQAPFAATASDTDGAVKQVALYLAPKTSTSTLSLATATSTAPVATLTATPYQGTLDTTKHPNGNYTLMAVATDDKGATSSNQRDVAINNTLSNPTPTPSPNPGSGTTLAANGARGVATFESLGMYWKPGSSPGSAGCSIRYRKHSESAWRQGFPMWYDARDGECRGSIVHLEPGTNYAVEMGTGTTFKAGVNIKTWSENFPIAKTVKVQNGSNTLAITESGTPNGYVLYEGPATLDAGNAKDYNVTIAARYVIVRGLTLKNAKIDGIRLLPGSSDVVIEDNDISNWGRSSGTVKGGVEVARERDSAIRAECRDGGGFSLERTVIQRNKLHHPRYGANSWDYGHPLGAQGIGYSFCGGNHVFRYNEIYSSDGGKYFKDGIAGEANFEVKGFPVADTDIYGNIVRHAWDDGIEAEGGNKNVRIWGNYIDQTAIGIATTVVHYGPLYMFRNVYNRSRKLSAVSLDQDQRLNFAKSGTQSNIGGGRRYVFHNTMLQATQSGATYPLGAGGGIIAAGSDSPTTNTVSRNNILHVQKANQDSIRTQGGGGNDFNHDLRNGGLSAYSGAEANGWVGVPIYKSGHGWSSWAGGNYQLESSSPGYDKALRLPNFNDGYTGNGPDVGAHEAGTPAMKLGVNASGRWTAQ
jgi:hypothetical protein